MPKGVHKNHARGSAHYRWNNAQRYRKTPLWVAWINMRSRCNTVTMPDYVYYGGRGIKVSRRWDTFEQFEADVGPYPGKGWTLDRKNTRGNYTRSNVRWATREQQARNRLYCKLTLALARRIRTDYFKKGMVQTEIAEKYNITQGHVSQIIRGVSWRELGGRDR